MKIEKKVWPGYLDRIISGEKTYDLRLADFDCKAGDILVLREWDPEKQKYTGRESEKEVTYVGKTKEMEFWDKKEIDKYGYQIISLKQ